MNFASYRLSREVIKDLRQCMGNVVFENVIPNNIRLAEAPGHALPIILYDRYSAGAAGYLAVTEEIMIRLNLKSGPDDFQKKPLRQRNGRYSRGKGPGFSAVHSQAEAG
jgi:hypothetical protein